MTTIRKTSSMVKPEAKKYRQVVKLQLLDVLRKSDRPMTTGDLFLATGKSDTFIRLLLVEMRDDGLVRSQTMDAHNKTYDGHELSHPAAHWSPAIRKKRSI